MTAQPSFTVEDLVPVVYGGVRVMTTDLLAKAYGASDKQIQDNFSNHRERFRERDHFFKIDGDELKQLRLHPDNIGLQISAKARHLILWTEKGAARHAKILETDQAWAVFGKLEDAYFQTDKIAAGDIAELLRRTDGITRMLAHKVTMIERAVVTITNHVDEMVINNDPRRSAVTYVSVRTLLDEAKALQKGRRSPGKKIWHALFVGAALAKPPVRPYRCPHSGVWLFPREFAVAYMEESGIAIVAAHNAAAAGQGILKFPARRRKKPLGIPGNPNPAVDAPGPG